MKLDGLLKSLSTVIQKRRQEMALSQDTVAERAGLSRTYFSDIERARRNFSVVTLTAIARALSTQGSELLRLAEQLQKSDGDAALCQLEKRDRDGTI